MHNLIQWLISVEDLAGNFYFDASVYFKQDEQFSDLLYILSQDETYHFHVLGSAERYIDQSKIIIKPEFTLNNDTKSRIEKPLRNNIKLLKENTIVKEDILRCIYETEFSEWNDIFIYVINSLKLHNRHFQSISSIIQDHIGRIEKLLLLYEEGKNYLAKIKSLPTVWEKSILFVDDSESILELLLAVFENEYSVDIAHNGIDAFEKIKKSYYDLIISDLDMPFMNGLELFDKALKFDTDIQKRFIIFSSLIDEDVKKQLLKKGLEYIIKPLDFDELIANIKNRL